MELSDFILEAVNVGFTVKLNRSSTFQVKEYDLHYKGGKNELDVRLCVQKDMDGDWCCFHVDTFTSYAKVISLRESISDFNLPRALSCRNRLIKPLDVPKCIRCLSQTLQDGKPL